MCTLPSRIIGSSYPIHVHYPAAAIVSSKMPTEQICMSMILLEPAHKILHTTVKFKRRTISVTPFFVPDQE